MIPCTAALMWIKAVTRVASSHLSAFPLPLSVLPLTDLSFPSWGSASRSARATMTAGLTDGNLCTREFVD